MLTKWRQMFNSVSCQSLIWKGMRSRSPLYRLLNRFFWQGNPIIWPPCFKHCPGEKLIFLQKPLIFTFPYFLKQWNIKHGGDLNEHENNSARAAHFLITVPFSCSTSCSDYDVQFFIPKRAWAHSDNNFFFLCLTWKCSLKSPLLRKNRSPLSSTHNKFSEVE